MRILSDNTAEINDEDGTLLEDVVSSGNSVSIDNAGSSKSGVYYIEVHQSSLLPAGESKGGTFTIGVEEI